MHLFIQNDKIDFDTACLHSLPFVVWAMKIKAGSFKAEVL